jgi:hypothetical protein
VSTRDDIMKDYVPVNERIGAFLAKHPDGSLQSELVELSDSRVVMRAYAYRSPDDPRPGIGYSSLEIPGRTPYTRGSEVENAETSAWGRAIAALGFEVKRGIASAEEVRNKSEDRDTASEPRTVQVGTQHLTSDGGLIGTAIAQGTQDFELRESPSGWTLPFRVKDGTHSFIVLAEDDLAQALYTIKPTVIDQRVTVWGHWTDELIPKRGNKPEIRYRVLHLERIQTPDGTLPAEPPVEAETAPLFDDAETAAIDAALDKVPAA